MRTLNRHGRWGRLAVIASAVWILMTLVSSFQVAYAPAKSDRFARPATFDFAEFLAGWVVLGILPVILAWGIAWALSATFE